MTFTDMPIIYLKDRFNYEYLTLRFGYPSHFAGTYNCGIAKYQPHPLIILQYNNIIVINNISYSYSRGQGFMAVNEPSPRAQPEDKVCLHSSSMATRAINLYPT